MFERTRGFFEGWFRALMSFALIPIILYGLLAMIMTIVGGQYTIAATTNVSGFKNGISVIGPLIIICLVGTALILQVQGIAAQIAGGAALNTQAGIRWAANAAKAGGGAATAFLARKGYKGVQKRVEKHQANRASKRQDKSGIKDAAPTPKTPSSASNINSPKPTGTKPASISSGSIGGNTT